jgi:15-cis-phytoene synthase
VSDLYGHCEAITRSQAGNFYYGIRLLPAPKRRALCAIYALARRIDDIGDGPLPAVRKLAALASEREQLLALDASSDPVLLALSDAARRFPIPLDAFVDLLDGVGMDVEGTHYERFEELELYCRRVAGSIGRLCLGVFGHSGPREHAMRLADELGVAMQLTNIVRDVREDAARGRLYLPTEDLVPFGWKIDPTHPAAAIAEIAAQVNGHAPPQVAGLVRFQALRASEWFARGLELVPLLDRRSASCVLAMTGIYRRLLELIVGEPEEVLRRRLSLPPWEKAWVAARSLTGSSA